MLINLSNHPSEMWSAEQIKAASCFGEIIDIAFPKVNPDGDESYIEELARQYVEKIHEKGGLTELVVHLMGEMNLTYTLVNRLQAEGVVCLASTTEHISQVSPDGRRYSVFRFVRFRKYK